MAIEKPLMPIWEDPTRGRTPDISNIGINYEEAYKRLKIENEQLKKENEGLKKAVIKLASI